MKQLEKMMVSAANMFGKNKRDIFFDLLKFIVGNFEPFPQPDPTWHYKKKQNVVFHNLMCEYFRVMGEKVKEDGMWYDAWGDLFMSMNVSGNNKGQFFTPSGLCDLMADISIKDGAEPLPTHVIGAFGKRVTISDCSCGSGRNLIAAHAKFVKNGWRKPYLVAEDIDIDCCRMTAVNMMVHGCYGEVICHNTLSEPETLRMGYIINEGLCPFPGLPTIRRCDDASRYFGISVMQYRREAASDKRETEKPESPKPQGQLSLW